MENTALCNYWIKAKDESQKALCSECDPGIAAWHGRFKKRSADGMLIDQSGHLWTQEQVDKGQLPSAYKIVGKVGDAAPPGV